MNDVLEGNAKAMLKVNEKIVLPVVPRPLLRGAARTDLRLKRTRSLVKIQMGTEVCDEKLTWNIIIFLTSQMPLRPHHHQWIKTLLCCFCIYIKLC